MMMRLLPLLLLAACGHPPQSEECKKWIRCSDAVVGGIPGSQDGAYGPSGTCWASTQEKAETCTAECVAATTATAKTSGAPQECK